MLKINLILSEIFLMQSKLRTHCMLKYIGQLKIAVNNHVRDDPWHTLATYTVSEIKTQFWQRNYERLSDKMSILK